MSTLALSLLDFQTALPFSNKIEDRQIQPFVAESLTLDLVPLLGHVVLEAIGQLTVPELTAYVPSAARTQDLYYVRSERVYRASADVATPAADTDSLEYQPLLTLWTQYLRLYWLRASFARFLPQHGQDFTKAGVTTPTDPQGTFRPVSATEKATLQAAHDTVVEALRSRLTAFLRTETTAYHANNATGYNYSHSQPTCHSSNTPHRTRLRGINRPRR